VSLAGGVITITGSTGRIGGLVARQLAAEEMPLCLVVRDAGRAPDLARAEIRTADYADGDAVRRALDGAVLMVSGAEAPNRLDAHRTFVDAAAAAGISHLVYTSFLAAAPRATFTLARDHWATEEHIRSTGLPFTFLRDNLYADFLPRMVGDDGVLRGPAADGRVSAVAQADVAAAAVAVLRSPRTHQGRTYDLTGPAAVTLHEAAQLMARSTGRAVRYEPETVEQAYASRASYGAPRWQLDAWVSTYTAIATGELAIVSDAVARLTGRPSMPFAAVLSGIG
jgi:NAD(P)H dehydrogenase (quinone)